MVNRTQGSALAGLVVGVVLIAGMPMASASDGDDGVCRLQQEFEQVPGGISLIPVTVEQNHGSSAVVATVIDPTTPDQVIRLITQVVCPRLAEVLMACLESNGQDPAAYLECVDGNSGQ
jgi:hypothetical protein